MRAVPLNLIDRFAERKLFLYNACADTRTDRVLTCCIVYSYSSFSLNHGEKSLGENSPVWTFKSFNLWKFKKSFFISNEAYWLFLHIRLFYSGTMLWHWFGPIKRYHQFCSQAYYMFSFQAIYLFSSEKTGVYTYYLVVPVY